MAKIARLGLDRLVDGVCVSEAEGCQKPDAEIFHQAAAKAGASMLGGWMVGDSLCADIAGGNRVGLTTVWISGGRGRPAEAPVPAHTVNDVSEAFALILGADR